MSDTNDKMLDRYVYLHIDYPLEQQDECQQAGICSKCFQVMADDTPTTVHVKLDDEGVVIDAWQEDVCVASTYKLYSEMGVEVKEIEDKTYSQKMQDELEPIDELDHTGDCFGGHQDV